MWAVTKSIKFQNKLAKEAILKALRAKSKNLFLEGMVLRCFMHVTENSIELFHIFENKEYVISGNTFQLLQTKVVEWLLKK